MLDEELKEEVKKTLPKGVKTVFFSSVAQQGLTDLKDLIWSQLNARQNNTMGPRGVFTA